ncbi:Histidine kinase-, DNA gyrase B-, and HSP90-like ATPase [Nitrosospira multiformis]|uniref:histidine kinase n=1 Tax=Nitrosospira multiformis TaxID=1231 RepID=A0A1H8QEL6_9PROT|nr:ATP-binding protein [Nitrosospira multiformis]SEO52675.1 Histidine kinase-, DNA gyrase B-, and HSP90-like ATPase [Nitrosospira multiformis]
MHDVRFDIRSTHFGGDWPISGTFRLRSFHSILNFIGRSADSEPEYDVEGPSHATFYPGTDARAKGTPGIGLGLALAQTIVHTHRGRIVASNQPEGGTELIIGLPLVR